MTICVNPIYGHKCMHVCLIFVGWIQFRMNYRNNNKSDRMFYQLKIHQIIKFDCCGYAIDNDGSKTGIIKFFLRTHKVTSFTVTKLIIFMMMESKLRQNEKKNPQDIKLHYHLPPFRAFFYFIDALKNKFYHSIAIDRMNAER